MIPSEAGGSEPTSGMHDLTTYLEDVVRQTVIGRSTRTLDKAPRTVLASCASIVSGVYVHDRRSCPRMLIFERLVHQEPRYSGDDGALEVWIVHRGSWITNEPALRNVRERSAVKHSRHPTRGMPVHRGSPAGKRTWLQLRTRVAPSHYRQPNVRRGNVDTCLG